ncbi:SDR family oxidoreductase [Labedella endophytica]|uniref:SDR family NAD(P)-dependent oxidoreductase n=1 Tax=Labedella endophytica TaxID=1523160 RepID=A0A433JPF8_9MICO|nr:SDR family NAD(P)-dependent oxidoreductase [Labedella endophytica]RUQ98287.1 SDR family NAD(P)-dependent oxidoreductase [Labedella endophytica]
MTTELTDATELDTAALAGRVVLLAGATSDAGREVTRAAQAAGGTVVATGRDEEKLAALADALPGVVTETVDLTDEAAVDALVARVHDSVGPVDGVLHLVGGFRRGDGIPGQSDADWAALETSLTALRHVSRAFYPDLVASPAGRLAIVSSTSAQKPHRNTANYSTVKAASETWTGAIASGFDADAPETAAAVIFAVSSLSGLEQELASRFVGLWSAEAATLNASRHVLTA